MNKFYMVNNFEGAYVAGKNDNSGEQASDNCTNEVT
jgi:hypothetical protein